MQALETAVPESSFVANYAPEPSAYDEMCTEAQHVRSHWQPLVQRLGTLGISEVGRRWGKAQELIHENGVTYNVYGDPRGMERPWNLSPLPVVVGPEDWLLISRGMVQRAELFEALLADLYGPQRVLTSGTLPPQIVFAHGNYLRALHGVSPPRNRWLNLYAADLVRGPDGAFRVIDDQTQTPSGAGYTLENRIVISSVLPEIFRECNVQRLALFFRAFREMTQSLAPHNRDNPRIVLLTSGRSNASYFEQAYLAQYLGFTLVDGNDLAVRDDHVFLKTLGGLQPVDVILRRVNDDFCDPLELRPDSLLGVAGLVQAARTGNVAIANPLGTGLAQSPALSPYLPALCLQLLGQELVLPSPRSWWCGEPSALPEVLARLDQLVVKPAFTSSSENPQFVGLFSAAEREALVRSLKATPEAYVAQEYVTPSTTPVITESGLTPRALVVRFHAVATMPRGFTIMPGGLARVADVAGVSAISMQRGARSKDVWVLSLDRVSGFTMLPPSNRPLALSRGGGDLPSRVADNLYWLGRYAERAESVARLARVIGARLLDLSSEGELQRSHEFGPLLAALEAQTEFLYSADIPYAESMTIETCEAALVSAVSDDSREGSLAGVIRAALRAGRLVRDRISMDTWRVLATLDGEIEDLRGARGGHHLSTLVNLLNRVEVTLSAFSGLAIDSMTRGQAFHFLDMGRRLERGTALVTLLRATTVRVSDREGPLLEAVLEIADSGMTYRRRYLATLQTPAVVDLVLADESNPRSAIYQLRALADHIQALPPLPASGTRSPQLRFALAALRELELAEVEPLCEPDPEGGRPLLEKFLRQLGTQLPQLSDSLSDSYLNHAIVSRHLVHEPATDSNGGGA
jgi:uncharacterized circularly permuted ATP-grasp superfamily protein/uncharacterized alpha-E superfamily protein